MVAGKIRSAVTSSKIAGMKQPGTVKKSPSDLRSPGGTPIAAWYTGRTVTFGLQQRSDFFWMLKSQIPHDQVLIYFDRTDLPVSDEMANTLKNEHVRFTALSPGARTSSAIPLWRTGPGCTRLFRSLVRAIFTEVALHALKLRRVRWFFISNVLVFAWQFSYWYDFFKSNGVKININSNDYSRMNICMHAAIEQNQGIAI